MAKTKKKTKEIEYAIKYLFEIKKMPTTKIALELGISEAIVDGVINAQSEDKPREISKPQDMMIRHTAGKNINNVSIMTQTASQYNDGIRSKIDTQQSRNGQNSIYRPNG